MNRWVWNSILIGIVVSMFAACGAGNDQGLRFQSKAFTPVTQSIVRKEDRITAEDLAHWIIEENKNLVLVDIRSQQDFDRGHIDTTRHIPMVELFTEQSLKQLPRDRKIVVYSNGSEDAAKAASMLRLLGYNAYLLLGGYNHWSEHVLNPKLADLPDEEMFVMEKRRAIACYFAGDYKPAAGLPHLAEQAADSAGYTPPLQPVKEDEESAQKDEESAEENEDVVEEEEGLIVEEVC